MIRYVLIVLLLLSLFSIANAEQKYNPFTNRWETVRPGAQMKYNPFGNSWEYVSPERPEPNQRPTQPYQQDRFPSLEYNPFSNRWEYPK